jgi:hypothetical protein
MEYSEKQEGTYLYRTLTLTPARLSVHGAEATSERKITFEQLEILEEEPGGDAEAGGKASGGAAQ